MHLHDRTGTLADMLYIGKLQQSTGMQVVI